MAKAKKKFHVYGKVVGTKYLGVVQAKNEDEAEREAENLVDQHIFLCNQCSKQVEGLEVQGYIIEDNL